MSTGGLHRATRTRPGTLRAVYHSTGVGENMIGYVIVGGGQGESSVNAINVTVVITRSAHSTSFGSPTVEPASHARITEPSSSIVNFETTLPWTLGSRARASS